MPKSVKQEELPALTTLIPIGEPIGAELPAAVYQVAPQPLVSSRYDTDAGCYRIYMHAYVPAEYEHIRLEPDTTGNGTLATYAPAGDDQTVSVLDVQLQYVPKSLGTYQLLCLSYTLYTDEADVLVIGVSQEAEIGGPVTKRKTITIVIKT